MRLTQMNGVDLARFEFDYDTTWTSFFLDEDLNIYSRYGGRDETGADKRLNPESLLHTMAEVKRDHRVRKAGEELARGLLHPAPAKEKFPEDMPLLQENHGGCLHCHQVREYQLLQAAHDGVFNAKQLFVFPLPENVGLKLDVKHGHRIEAVEKESPAHLAGLKPNDVIRRVNDVPVRSQYDVRWAMHRAEVDKPLEFVVERPTEGGKYEQLTKSLNPVGKWKQTELGWRKSLRSVPLRLGFLAYALGAEERRTRGLDEAQLAIRVLSVRGAGLAKNVGLLKGDIITALGENRTARGFEEFQSDLLRQFSPGDQVKLEVFREGKRQELEGKFPDWYTIETSVP